MFPFDLAKNRKALLATLYIRYFGFHKIPMLFFIRPTLVDWKDDLVTFRVPLNRKTKNHLDCMYFGVLAAGADLAAGFTAMSEIKKQRAAVSLIFKDFRAEFLKRAEGDVHFTCSETKKVRTLVDQAISSGQRVHAPVNVTATVPEVLGDQPVAQFTLTLSLKAKEANSASSSANKKESIV